MRENSLYSRQEPLGLTQVESAIVVGVGGTGTWVAIFLAMSGVKRLHLMDDDSLEVSNLNRLPYTFRDLGLRKVEVAKSLLTSLRPELIVECYPSAGARTLELVEGTHLFDCTDRHDVQLMLYEWCRKREINYTRVGYDGTHMTVTDSVPAWNVGDDEEGYINVPSWVVPAVLAAGLGVAKALHHSGIEVSHEISEFGSGVPRLEEEEDGEGVDADEEGIGKFGTSSEPSMSTICRVCGRPYGDHSGWACPE